ncbi:MAG: hypothetical protein KDA28_14015, partial [Phycisphaerales bacterium]|nr:hypothetical protein [Phycisphaerales bacterium]
GARVIVDRMEDYGVSISKITHCGGIAEKSDLVNQIYADILGRRIRISGSPQTCALGAAIFGSIVGGAHRSVHAAQKSMVTFKDTEYAPRREARAVYDDLFGLYRVLHDAMGDVGGPEAAKIGTVMPRLLEIQERARARASNATSSASKKKTTRKTKKQAGRKKARA